MRTGDVLAIEEWNWRFVGFTLTSISARMGKKKILKRGTNLVVRLSERGDGGLSLWEDERDRVKELETVGSSVNQQQSSLTWPHGFSAWVVFLAGLLLPPSHTYWWEDWTPVIFFLLLAQSRHDTIALNGTYFSAAVTSQNKIVTLGGAIYLWDFDFSVLYVQNRTYTPGLSELDREKQWKKNCFDKANIVWIPCGGKVGSPDEGKVWWRWWELILASLIHEIACAFLKEKIIDPECSM